MFKPTTSLWQASANKAREAGHRTFHSMLRSSGGMTIEYSDAMKLTPVIKTARFSFNTILLFYTAIGGALLLAYSLATLVFRENQTIPLTGTIVYTSKEWPIYTFPVMHMYLSMPVGILFAVAFILLALLISLYLYVIGVISRKVWLPFAGPWVRPATVAKLPKYFVMPFGVIASLALLGFNDWMFLVIVFGLINASMALSLFSQYITQIKLRNTNPVHADEDNFQQSFYFVEMVSFLSRLTAFAGPVAVMFIMAYGVWSVPSNSAISSTTITLPWQYVGICVVLAIWLIIAPIADALRAAFPPPENYRTATTRMQRLLSFWFSDTVGLYYNTMMVSLLAGFAFSFINTTSFSHQNVALAAMYNAIA